MLISLLSFLSMLLACPQQEPKPPKKLQTKPEETKKAIKAPPPKRCVPAPSISTLDAWNANIGAPSVGNGITVTADYILAAGYTQKKRSIEMKWVVRRARSFDPTVWQDVDRWPQEQKRAFASAILQTKRGYYAIGGLSSGMSTEWVVRWSATSDPGTWSIVDRYLPKGASSAIPRGAAVVEGKIIAVGTVDYKEGRGSTWTVRMSATGEPGTWSDIDTYSEPGHETVSGLSVAGHKGMIYVAGVLQKKYSTPSIWIIRKSEDGATWNLSDRFTSPKLKSTRAVDIDVAPDGTVIAVGYASLKTKKMKHRWIIRRSKDRGKTWQTLDEKGVPAGMYSTANAVTIGSKGAIYVGGSAKSKKEAVWLLRRSRDGGNTWEEVDRYEHDETVEAADKIEDIAIDARGYPFALGDAHTKQSGRTWVVRGRSCQ